jgi:hypothetical protein
MCRCRAHWAHLEQLYIHASPRTLPRRLASGEPRPDNFDDCHSVYREVYIEARIEVRVEVRVEVERVFRG